MKSVSKIFLFLIFYACSAISGQTYNPKIDSLLTEVNRDSLISYVRALSGEDSVFINGKKSLIKNRIYYNGYNELAADYIFEKFTNYGLDPEYWEFDDFSKNVIAIQSGKSNSSERYILCAHYDSVTDYCADDNASGTAVVLEIARILSKEDLDIEIIYALWDKEEVGLFGSYNYALYLSDRNVNVNGVINLDMVGYDKNKDGLMEIHTDYTVAGTDLLYEPIIEMNSIYEIGLNPILFKSGTGASDHRAFLEYDYPAVLLIEGYYNNDFNPDYHSVRDRIDKFNLDYFHKMAKLTMASTANFVLPEYVTDIEPQPLSNDFILHNNYPNPFNPTTIIKYSLPETSFINLTIYDVLGKEIKTLVNETQTAGEYGVEFNADGIPSGTYFYRFKSKDLLQTKKMLLLK